MYYKNFLINIFFFLLLSNCVNENLSISTNNEILSKNFSNKGFALIYNDDLFDKKTVSKRINERSLIIIQRNLKKNSQVKVINILNNKSLLAKVGENANYPLFNNSVVSSRIAVELDLDPKEPYVQILSVQKNTLFIAKKAKTYEEEKEVAEKVPVNNISIDDLNSNNKISKKKVKKNMDNKFSYTIKIADFYFNDTALEMIKRIKSETNVKKANIKKISNRKYRVYLGPFDEINSLKKSFNDINILEFENIEIIKND